MDIDQKLQVSLLQYSYQLGLNVIIKTLNMSLETVNIYSDLVSTQRQDILNLLSGKTYDLQYMNVS